MARREFDWIDYDVSLPTSLIPQMRSLVIAQAAAPEPEAAEAAPMTRVTLPLPNLGAYPTPRDKAKILLESAAEVEHSLMVQYLYATYSLKSKDQVDGEHKQLLDWDDETGQSWPLTLLAIAREEMGHLMTVQNLLILLGLAPNFEREDFPARTNLYPFPLKLGPLTRSSLAKYVVAEGPWDATGIAEIIDLATAKAGSAINHVGILYGLVGVVFCRQDQIDGGATGHAYWDAILRLIRDAAYKQDQAPERWHLPDGEFHPETLEHQADPNDWTVAQPQIRVHRVTNRAAALNAIRDIGEQGEGPSSEGEASHFERFLRVFRGAEGQGAFPLPGVWVPTRPVPTDPKLTDFTHPRTRGWAELADVRYALLLGFLGHYMGTSGDVRRILTGWIFAEMRSRLGFIARELTSMPADNDPSSTDCAAAPFTLPRLLTLPDDEGTRWCVHLVRTTEAIAIVQRLLRADTPDSLDEFLRNLLASDQARLKTMKEHAEPTATSFVRDIQPLFRPKDIEHMRTKPSPASRIDLANLTEVKGNAGSIEFFVETSDDESRMPPPPGQRWTPTQVELLQQWINESFPP
jgi:hypothetical protein